MKGIIKKADIALAAVLLLFCAGTAWFAYGFGSDGADIEISVDGKLYGTYSLSKDDVIDVDTDLGHNQVTIKDGKAFMSEASCPDGYCLGQHKSAGGINRSDQTLVCLPNRVVVSVTGDGSDGQNGLVKNESGGADAVSGSQGAGAAPDAVAGTPAAGSGTAAENDADNDADENDPDKNDIDNGGGSDE